MVRDARDCHIAELRGCSQQAISAECNDLHVQPLVGRVFAGDAQLHVFIGDRFGCARVLPVKRDGFDGAATEGLPEAQVLLRRELAALYRGAAALLFPTRYEGFGLPVLEAMASGTPIVATPDEAVREVAGDAAVYALPHELAPAVLQALAERDRLVAAGLERARTFSWEEAARRTAAVYHEVLAE